MIRNLALAALSTLLPLSVYGEFADYTFVPPTKSAAATTAQGPIPKQSLATRMKDPFPRHVFNTYAGKSTALEAASAMPDLQVGAGLQLDWTDTALFGTPLFLEGAYHFRAAIRSEEAHALRLQVDLHGLAPGETLWLVETAGGDALGPFTVADALPEGNWLPTTVGSEVVLWITSNSDTPPQVTVTALSHFYKSLSREKQNLPCPLTPDCVTSTPFQEVSTGIGRLSVTDDRGTTALCSGALINNAETETLEAYFLTADHCFQEIFSGTIFASALEVIWDFRPGSCGSTDPSANVLSQLLRSTGTAFLASSESLDGVLLQLSAVPVGTRGRAYLGWDTRDPVVGEAVAGIHHPGGNPMKASLGSVNGVDVGNGGGLRQTELRWTEGLTEQGSSGSPSLFDDGTLRIFGMLSTGNFQFCGDTAPRLDQYTNFREFFAQIGGFLTNATPPSNGRTTFSNATGAPTTVRGCIQATSQSRAAVGDLLLAGLAVLTLLGMGRLRS